MEALLKGAMSNLGQPSGHVRELAQSQAVIFCPADTLPTQQSRRSKRFTLPHNALMNCTDVDPAVLTSPSIVAALLEGEALLSARANPDPGSLIKLSYKLLRGEPTALYVRRDTLHDIAQRFVQLLRRDAWGTVTPSRVAAIDSTTGVVITSCARPREEVLRVIRWVGLQRTSRRTMPSPRPTLCNPSTYGRGAILPGCFSYETFPNHLEWNSDRNRYELPPDGRWQWTAWATRLEEPHVCFRSSEAVSNAITDFSDEFRRQGIVALAHHVTVVHRRDDIGTCLVEMVFPRQQFGCPYFNEAVESGPRAMLWGGPLDSAGSLVPLSLLSTNDNCLTWTVRPESLQQRVFDTE